MKQNFGRAPYYVLGENTVRSYCFFQYHYKNGDLHIEAWLGTNNVEEGLVGWGSVMDKSTYLQIVHQLIEELLAMLPANNPVVINMRNELVEERKLKKAGNFLPAVMLCLRDLMMVFTE